MKYIVYSDYIRDQVETFLTKNHISTNNLLAIHLRNGLDFVGGFSVLGSVSIRTSSFSETSMRLCQARFEFLCIRSMSWLSIRKRTWINQRYLLSVSWANSRTNENIRWKTSTNGFIRCCRWRRNDRSIQENSRHQSYSICSFDWPERGRSSTHWFIYN